METDEFIKVLTKDQDEKKNNYMGLSELMRMNIIFVTFCLSEFKKKNPTRTQRQRIYKSIFTAK